MSTCKVAQGFKVSWSQPTVRLLLRIPASLKTKLTELAEREHRSLNRQIEFVLDRYMREKSAKEGNRSSRSKGDDRNVS
jgi:hypothetical protein